MTKNPLLGMLLIIGLMGNYTYAQPVIENPNLTMNPDNVLRATLNFTTDTPTKALAILQNDEHTITVPSTQGMTTAHQMEILGLHPQEIYAVTISVVDAMEQTTYNDSLQLETQSLPDDFPPLEITISEPDKMQQGITFFDIRRWVPARDDWGLIIAIDEQGKVVWYHKDASMTAVSQMHNQNLLYLRNGNAIEMDMLGNKKHIWVPAQLNPPISKSFHHDVIERPSGNLLTLIKDIRTIDGYIDENGGQISRQIKGDSIVEFTPEGQVVRQWDVFDMLDPHRIKGSLDGPPNSEINWTHANSVFYDERDDSILVSLRAQDWIIKFDRATGELLWRFGEDGDFSMLGNGEWPFHHHAARFLTDGSLLMYDNGNGRTGIEDANDLYSRAVQYQLDTSSSDPDQWTATQLWEFRDSEKFYSPFLSEVNHLANSNFLIADGGRVADPELSNRDEKNQKWARIVEVTSTNPAEKVFELIIRDETPDKGYSVYRSEKLANLVWANLGPTVRFTDPAQIPTGLDLTTLLPTLSADSEIEQSPSVDLSVDLFGNDGSILETLNTLPRFSQPESVLNQDATWGYIYLDMDDLRFALFPSQVKHSLEKAMLQVDNSQNVRFVTNDGLDISTFPAVQQPQALQMALSALGLNELTIQSNGHLKIPVSRTLWYSARPDWVSLTVNEKTKTGLTITTIPVSFVFEDDADNKRQQLLYPAPANMEALLTFAKRVEFSNGMLSFQFKGKTYRGLLDYVVESQGNNNDSLEISTIPDENEDNLDDYLLSYPNGESQKLFAVHIQS